MTPGVAGLSVHQTPTASMHAAGASGSQAGESTPFASLTAAASPFTAAPGDSQRPPEDAADGALSAAAAAEGGGSFGGFTGAPDGATGSSKAFLEASRKWCCSSETRGLAPVCCPCHALRTCRCSKGGPFAQRRILLQHLRRQQHEKFASAASAAAEELEDACEDGFECSQSDACNPSSGVVDPYARAWKPPLHAADFPPLPPPVSSRARRAAAAAGGLSPTPATLDGEGTAPCHSSAASAAALQMQWSLPPVGLRVVSAFSFGGLLTRSADLVVLELAHLAPAPAGEQAWQRLAHSAAAPASHPESLPRHQQQQRQHAREQELQGGKQAQQPPRQENWECVCCFQVSLQRYQYAELQRHVYQLYPFTPMNGGKEGHAGAGWEAPWRRLETRFSNAPSSGENNTAASALSAAAAATGRKMEYLTAGQEAPDVAAFVGTLLQRADIMSDVFVQRRLGIRQQHVLCCRRCRRRLETPHPLSPLLLPPQHMTLPVHGRLFASRVSLELRDACVAFIQPPSAESAASEALYGCKETLPGVDKGPLHHQQKQQHAQKHVDDDGPGETGETASWRILQRRSAPSCWLLGGSCPPFVILSLFHTSGKRISLFPFLAGKKKQGSSAIKAAAVSAGTAAVAVQKRIALMAYPQRDKAAVLLILPKPFPSSFCERLEAAVLRQQATAGPLTPENTPKSDSRNDNRTRRQRRSVACGLKIKSRSSLLALSVPSSLALPWLPPLTDTAEAAEAAAFCSERGSELDASDENCVSSRASTSLFSAATLASSQFQLAFSSLQHECLRNSIRRGLCCCYAPLLSSFFVGGDDGTIAVLQVSALEAPLLQSHAFPTSSSAAAAAEHFRSGADTQRNNRRHTSSIIASSIGPLIAPMRLHTPLGSTQYAAVEQQLQHLRLRKLPEVIKFIREEPVDVVALLSVQLPAGDTLGSTSSSRPRSTSAADLKPMLLAAGRSGSVLLADVASSQVLASYVAQKGGFLAPTDTIATVVADETRLLLFCCYSGGSVRILQLQQCKASDSGLQLVVLSYLESGAHPLHMAPVLPLLSLQGTKQQQPQQPLRQENSLSGSGGCSTAGGPCSGVSSIRCACIESQQRLLFLGSSSSRNGVVSILCYSVLGSNCNSRAAEEGTEAVVAEASAARVVLVARVVCLAEAVSCLAVWPERGMLLVGGAEGALLLLLLEGLVSESPEFEPESATAAPSDRPLESLRRRFHFHQSGGTFVGNQRPNEERELRGSFSARSSKLPFPLRMRFSTAQSRPQGTDERLHLQQRGFGGDLENVLRDSMAANAESMLLLRAHNKSIRKILLFPSEAVFVSCGAEGTLKMWRMPPTGELAD
ncbi:uncharacterized protein LOC34623941 [Cyclospora cayetanensis]|uniref:Uncharacterized protein LOC34623941 n=1 Tax=Cyclospora cayetanensis TaxID=88456 RepID=A0A6P6S0Y3_9EIME|nr:uncharacterized protein LOC34623941 [Cyclospora cayetanensis]